MEWVVHPEKEELPPGEWYDGIMAKVGKGKHIATKLDEANKKVSEGTEDIAKASYNLFKNWYQNQKKNSQESIFSWICGSSGSLRL